MVVLITKWSWKGDVFIGSPGSSDEDIEVSSNAYCPANDPLGLAAQMTERESRGSEVASVLQVVTTRRRSMFKVVFIGQREMEYRSPLLCMWAKRVVARRVMKRSDAVLVASRYYNGSG